ncbi:MAG: ankyrin repeat domain-containing protein [Thiotrichaceae bacterium]
MKKFALLSYLVLLPGMTTHAADKDFCSDYVLVAISQYWQSVDEGCGFTGLRWSADYKGQYDWCLTAHQWVAENETDSRTKLLEECRVNQTSKSAESDTIVVVKKGTPGSDNLNKQLLKAVANNNLAEVKALVKNGADIHFETDDEALIKSLGMSSHLGKAITVVSNGVSKASTETTEVTGNSINGSPQATQVKSESLLSYATSKGLVDIGLWLLEQDKENLTQPETKKIKDDLLGRALIGAVEEKDPESVDALLKKGARVDYELDQNFGTPLYFAVRGGSHSIAKTLLEKGASAKYSTNAGQNMLNYALGDVAMLMLLLDHGADPNSNGESTSMVDYPIIQAVKQASAQVVELLMLRGANADISDYEVTYPLLQAIAEQQVDTVEALLNNGANPNVVYNADSPGSCVNTSKNRVPLSEAVEVGNNDIVVLLKKSGAKTEAEVCKINTK